MPSFPHPRRPLAALALAAAVGAVACDYPTELPRWDTRWEIPADSTALRVDSLLPARVRVAGDRSAFLLALDPVAYGRSLGQACGACGAAQGQSVPKPAFTLVAAGQSLLPADVGQVALAGGTVTVTVTNQFGFDPLRPAAAPGSPTGSLTLTVASGGVTLGTVQVSGAQVAFPSGTSLVRQVALQPATVAGPVDVTLSLTSPAGDAVVVDTARRVSLVATVDEARVASAAVRVQSRAVELDDVALDLDDIDASLEERVVDGAVVLDIANPFAVAGSFTATIVAPGTTITRQVTVPAGASTATLALSGDELRALLGSAPVTFGASGTVSSTAGGFVTVTPSQVLRVASRLRLTLRSEAP